MKLSFLLVAGAAIEFAAAFPPGFVRESIRLVP